MKRKKLFGFYGLFDRLVHLEGDGFGEEGVDSVSFLEAAHVPDIVDEGEENVRPFFSPQGRADEQEQYRNFCFYTCRRSDGNNQCSWI